MVYYVLEGVINDVRVSCRYREPGTELTNLTLYTLLNFPHPLLLYSSATPSVQRGKDTFLQEAEGIRDFLTVRMW